MTSLGSTAFPLDQRKPRERFARTDPKEGAAIMAEEDGPVPLVEDGATGDRFLIYSAREGVRVELKVDGDTFWASQSQMAEAFGVTPQNITMHLRNIFKEGELHETAVCKQSLQTGRDGKTYSTKLYDLNALISVGYRVSGPLGTAFRILGERQAFPVPDEGLCHRCASTERAGQPGSDRRTPGDYSRHPGG